ncbi:2,3-bisphosphoglycerate-independent phosphoglycerate mutase [Geobacter argillaceus]|uniref:2,3-bisphosphoglycerate-independent phosphoglycerate mutase n=1 Tax=Geobacter argillaceus TaxID=345631 RepID=A0A562VIB5_9BACT|nr:2,3-bisphosphoglycerate-independent phosphoglycerate mutase [Geobacter argillaceus]TWJ17610.1 phosphoglycerate mutase [Geobacter argillaceus]
MAKKPLLLMILDGWGINPNRENNAVAQADTPNLSSCLKEYPHTRILTSGMAVGLPEGQMGNSEVGHLNIGAGRVVYQDLTRISKAISDGDFFENPVLLDCLKRTKAAGGRLHLAGLLSDGGVHSHNTHLYGLLELAKRHGLTEVFVHCFMDGRDTPPRSGGDYLAELEAKIKEIGVGTVATVSGRYYAMDRDNRWERVEKAYNAMVLGEGETATSTAEAIARTYAADVTDEFVLPTVITAGGAPVGSVADNDGFIFFNFRSDRAREITRVLALDEFSGFPHRVRPKLSSYVCMTEYDATFGLPIAFDQESLTNILGGVLAAAGKHQLRIAETEKYAHVTFFFNGGVEEPFAGEERCLIPSPKEVATYDLKPEMSAYPVTEELLRRLDGGTYDVIVLNFANCDMVGHTGILAAAIKAVEAVDACVGRIVAKVRELGGTVLITADHGNADQMAEENGEPYTAHTCNPVWLVLVDDARKQARLKDEGRLADIAPTMLDILGIEKPREMTGVSLLEK